MWVLFVRKGMYWIRHCPSVRPPQNNLNLWGLSDILVEEPNLKKCIIKGDNWILFFFSFDCISLELLLRLPTLYSTDDMLESWFNFPPKMVTFSENNGWICQYIPFIEPTCAYCTVGSYASLSVRLSVRLFVCHTFKNSYLRKYYR